MQHTVTPESLKTTSSLTQVNSAHRDKIYFTPFTTF